jgi:putative oxygen-independent coproporphyrinogen III oxidase
VASSSETGIGNERAPQAPPLSLYLHLPWCERKCPYCDFNSYELRGAVPEREYVDALLQDLEAEAPLTGGRAVSSVFIGGGTPSLFSGGAIARLLDGVRARTALAPGAEITLEANPGSAEAGRFAAFRDAGVNRLSIGAQSLRAPQLAALGRVHDASEALRAIAIARAAGFDNLNVDLMYGLPGDDVAGALSDLEQVLALEPDHVSWYQLTLEPDTAFHRRPPPLPDEETVLAIEDAGRALLGARGYARYEVSAFARPGRRCAHNLNYWSFGDYLGIGAGAHGKLTQPGAVAIERRARTRNPRTYVALAGTAASVSVDRIGSGSDLIVEFMMNALRLVDGFSVASFEQRTGQPLAAIAASLAEAARQGWLTVESDCLRPTPEGLKMLNRVLELFVAADHARDGPRFDSRLAALQHAAARAQRQRLPKLTNGNQ